MGKILDVTNTRADLLFCFFFWLFHSALRVSDCKASNDRIISELINWKGSGRKQPFRFKILTWISHGRTQNPYRILSLCNRCPSWDSNKSPPKYESKALVFPGSLPGLVKWDLWWTNWRWGRFSPSTSVSPANFHSTKFSILTITLGRYNKPVSGRRAEWTQFGLHPPLWKK
jgi:hypothetical protein